MKLSLKVSTKWLDFLDGLTELNANDVMWKWMEIYLDTPLSVRQSLWVKYTHKKYGEHSHEILFAEDGTNKLARAYIPSEVIRIPGEWSFQAFIRQYTLTDPTKYIQTATNVVTFTVANGLPLDADGAPVTNATIGALYEMVKSRITPSAYVLEVLSTDSVWEQVNGKWQVRIPQTKHNFKTIHSVVAERKMTTDMYENMIYTYKRYLSGSVAVIVDFKVDMRIVIKGGSIGKTEIVDTKLSEVRLNTAMETGKLSVTYPDGYDTTAFELADGRLYATTKTGVAKPKLYLENGRAIFEM